MSQSTVLFRFLIVFSFLNFFVEMTCFTKGFIFVEMCFCFCNFALISLMWWFFFFFYHRFSFFKCCDLQYVFALSDLLVGFQGHRNYEGIKTFQQNRRIPQPPPPPFLFTTAAVISVSLYSDGKLGATMHSSEDSWFFPFLNKAEFIFNLSVHRHEEDKTNSRCQDP